MAQIECALAFLLAAGTFYAGIFIGMLRREFFDALAAAVYKMKHAGTWRKSKSMEEYKADADVMRYRVQHRFDGIKHRYMRGLRVR